MFSAIAHDFKARNGYFNLDVQVLVEFFSSLLVQRTLDGRVEVAIQLVQFLPSETRALPHFDTDDLMFLGVGVVGGPRR